MSNSSDGASLHKSYCRAYHLVKDRMSNVIIVIFTALEVLSLLSLIILLAAVTRLARRSASFDALLSDADDLH